METSLHLIHKTSSRWRFKLRHLSNEFCWSEFTSSLHHAFPQKKWRIRVNSNASSIVVVLLDPERDSQNLMHYSVRRCIVQQLNQQGLSVADLPLTPTEVLTSSHEGSPRLPQKIFDFIGNCASFFFALPVSIVAIFLFFVGFIGLFIPYFPGFFFLLLASVAFDLIVGMRRPFVRFV